MGSGLVGLHMKGALTGKSFTICRNWLALEETGSSGSSKPQDVNTSKIQKIKAWLIDGDKNSRITMPVKVFCMVFIARWSLMASLESLPWMCQPLNIVFWGAIVGYFWYSDWEIPLPLISGRRGVWSFLLSVWIYSTNFLSDCKSKSVIFPLSYPLSYLIVGTEP